MIWQKYKDRFLAYMKREHFDNVQRIDPFEYHSVFIAWTQLFCVTDGEIKMWMYLSPIISAIVAIFGLFISITSATHFIAILDLSLITETTTNLFLMIYICLMLICMRSGKKEYLNLLQAMKDDFRYFTARKQKYRESFLEHHRLTFIGCICIIVAQGSVVGSMVPAGYLAVALATNRDDTAERPMLFSFWFFDYDLHATPVYEFVFITTYIFPMCFCYNYAFVMQSHIMWVREATSKADFIIWGLQDLLADVLPATNDAEKKHHAAIIKHRMKEIVNMHISMYSLIEDYTSVYMKCCIFEQLIASPIICMSAYCFVERYAVGELRPVLLVQCIGASCLVFIPNYLCTYLVEKVDSIRDACYDVPFWNVGPEIRPYLILIMQKSAQPLPLSAPGLAEISLQTYSTVMTRAYRGFNMLRQLDLGFD